MLRKKGEKKKRGGVGAGKMMSRVNALSVLRLKNHVSLGGNSSRFTRIHGFY